MIRGRGKIFVKQEWWPKTAMRRYNVMRAWFESSSLFPPDAPSNTSGSLE